jgi:hypothetical protein
MFMIADGAHVDRSGLPNNGEGWFNPHCRILGVVDFMPQGDIIFIVGSDDVHNPKRFVQVASWDEKTFHYYAVWILSPRQDQGLTMYRLKTLTVIRKTENGHTKATHTMLLRTGHLTTCHILVLLMVMSTDHVL